MEFALCAASLKIHQPLDLNEKNRARTEKDISHLFLSLDLYLQNYSKLHFLLYFTGNIFAFHISATEK